MIVITVQLVQCCNGREQRKHIQLMDYTVSREVYQNEIKTKTKTHLKKSSPKHKKGIGSLDAV